MEEEDDPFLSDDFDATPLVPGCVDAIRALSDERFGERVFLVTVARAQVRRRSAPPGGRGRTARLCQHPGRRGSHGCDHARPVWAGAAAARGTLTRAAGAASAGPGKDLALDDQARLLRADGRRARCGPTPPETPDPCRARSRLSTSPPAPAEPSP